MTPYYSSDYNIPWYDITSIETGLGALLMHFFMGLWVLLAAVGITCYILGGIGQMKLAKKLGIPNGWLAFIPIANYYLLGKLSDCTPDGQMKRTKHRHILLWLSLGLILCGLILGGLIAVASLVTGGALAAGLFAVLTVLAVIAVAVVFEVFYYIAVFRIFKAFEPNNYGLYFALSLVSGLLLGFPLESIFFFLLGRRPYSPFYGYPPQNGYGYPNGNGYAYGEQPGSGYAPPYEAPPSDQTPPQA